MKTKQTILFITSRFPFPLEKGDKLRAYYQIKELSVKYNIILCALSTKKVEQTWINELSPFCQSIHVFKLNSLLKYWNTLKMGLTQKPFQVGYFYQKNLKKQIHKIIKNEKPDILYSQLVRTTEYIKDIHNIPKTLDYMDALSAGMDKRAQIANWIKKIPLQIEGNRLRIYENKIFDYFDQHTIISEQDQKLISHPSNRSIQIIPNGIDDYFTQYDTSKIKKEYDLVFVGNLSYPPNIESCLFIVNEILPLFKKNNQTVKVLLSGANPSSKVLKLKQNKNVTVIGWTKDIRENYVKGKIFIAPLFIGTGLQNKLLEAMSLGIPSITTSLANNALKAEPNKEILIANSANEFYNQICVILNDKELSDILIKKAQSFIRHEYNWKTSTNKIKFDKN